MTTATGKPACGRCGSTVLRRYAYGLPSRGMAERIGGTPEVRLAGCVIGPDSWDVECLSCGQRRYLDRDDHSRWSTATAIDESGVAQAVQRYAEQARAAMDTSQTEVISYAGL